MKRIKHYQKILVICYLTMLGACSENDPYSFGGAFCEEYEGGSLEDHVGRIYWNTGKSFYYIGNPDPEYSGGGYVPCEFLAPNFLPIGDEPGPLIQFSGKLKEPANSETDPLYTGIEITSIELYNPT